MSNEVPTDALRLVPASVLKAFETIAKVDAKLADGDTTIVNISRIRDLVNAAAPASPLPEGGGQCSEITGELKSPDLDALEKLADEATPGPWKFMGEEYADNGGKYFSVMSKGWDTIVGEWGPHESNAALIAAANPATIKALIAELREARGLLERALTAIDPWGVGSETTIISEARAFLARNGKGEG